jgi:hypothetical protein
LQRIAAVEWKFRHRARPNRFSNACIVGADGRRCGSDDNMLGNLSDRKCEIAAYGLVVIDPNSTLGDGLESCV